MIADKQRLWSNLLRAAIQEVDAVLSALPHPLQKRARELPVTYEPKPNKALIKEGVEHDRSGQPLIVSDCQCFETTAELFSAWTTRIHTDFAVIGDLVQVCDAHLEPRLPII